MTTADKVIHIQDLQLAHFNYSTTLSNKLSYGTSCYKDLDQNALIHYMIKAWYRYWALPSALRNYHSIDITAIDSTSSFNIEIDTIEVANLVLTDTTTELATTAIIADINTNAPTTGVYAFEIDGKVYLWSSKITYALTDLPVINVTVGSVTSTITKLDETDPSLILNQYNCLTYCQIGNIKCYLKNLMATCR